MITMLLGGLWHGAGWNFLLWGGLHGIFLVINHVWHTVKSPVDVTRVMNTISAWLLTFVAVVFAWVPFRATSYEGTINMWRGMLGWNGAYFLDSLHDKFNLLEPIEIWVIGPVRLDGLLGELLPNPANFWWIGILMLAIVTLPNTQQFMQKYHPVLTSNKDSIRLFRSNGVFWTPNKLYATGIAFLFFFTLTSMSGVSEFLYFNF